MNLYKAKDEAWSRQRRIVAPALNERIMSEVWRESAEQATTFADILLAPSSISVREARQTITGLRTLAMNVLARIAYGHRKPFVPQAPVRDPTSSMSYVDAIALCTELLVAAALLPAGLLKLPFMPNSLQCLGVALQRLPELTKNMLDWERHEGTGSVKDHSDTIMSILVRLSDQEKEQADRPLVRGGSVGKSYLTEDEIAGNLFIFTAAGFDTTANTMSYACTLLAAYPQWQTWIQGELDTVLGLAEPDYATAFPKLIRCMAVMVTQNSQTFAPKDANGQDSLKPFASFHQ
jgi:cytochrome P450